MSQQSRLVRYSGDVQGVGFRYTAMRLAEQFDVTGYVRNLPNGQVELLAEGSPEQVEAFLEAIREQMGQYIQNVQQTDHPPTGQYHSFNIRH